MGKAARRQNKRERRGLERAEVGAPAPTRPPSSPAPLVVAPGLPDEWRPKLHNAVVKQREAQRQVAELVAVAAGSGASWAEIGKVLGVTRQSAHRRFHHLGASDEL